MRKRKGNASFFLRVVHMIGKWIAPTAASPETDGHAHRFATRLL
jgi:hypothetical protein